jgi:hypothetical protein
MWDGRRDLLAAAVYGLCAAAVCACDDWGEKLY